jgi:hypothetical protein
LEVCPLAKKDPAKVVEQKVCSRCKKTVPSVSPLDKGSKDKLAQKGHADLAEGQYCKVCLSYVMNEAFSTVLEKRVKIEQDKRKSELWQSRIKFLKQGKNAFQSKNTIEAVKNYSSYLLVLEKVLDIGPGELSPDFFRTIRGEKEKSIVALVYFDLMRIYDKSEPSYNNFIKCIEKVRVFALSTKEGKGILKSIEHYLNYSGEAVHKKELKKLYIELNKKIKIKKKCFIATYIYQDYDCHEVRVLRYFRDNFLLRYKTTGVLVEIYYDLAPKLIPVLDRNRILKALTRIFLNVFIGLIEKFVIRKTRKGILQNV